jgi:hypothetical protein
MHRLSSDWVKVSVVGYINGSWSELFFSDSKISFFAVLHLWILDSHEY